jgi:hypothetical protein
MGGLLLILALIVLMAACQMVAIAVFWRRFTWRLRHQEPSIATVAIHSFGPDAGASARVLARYTRLDTGEIDELVGERRTGPLPLPLPWRRANLLAAELRRLGGDAEVQYR